MEGIPSLKKKGRDDFYRRLYTIEYDGTDLYLSDDLYFQIEETTWMMRMGCSSKYLN